MAKAWLQSSSSRYKSDRRASSGVKQTCPQKSRSPTPRIRKPTWNTEETQGYMEDTVLKRINSREEFTLCLKNSNSNKHFTHLERAATPSNVGCQDVSVGNNEKRQKDSHRKQPDERPPPAVTAVALVTG